MSNVTETAVKEKKVKKELIPYEKKKQLYGYGFIALWFVGAIVFFIYPLIQSLVYTFVKMKISPGKIDISEFVGFSNFKYVLTQHPSYTKDLIGVLQDTGMKTVIILVFSLFIAVLLNQKFKGRVFARAVFFLPVIIATGPVYAIITNNLATQGNASAGQFSTMFEADLVGQLLEFIGIYGISPQFTETIQTVISDIFNLVWNSGVQILIFLAALQTIPTSAREAAQMEGATAWEFFWKITFPYVSPMILANFVFTVIDTFTDPTNPIMKLITSRMSDWDYSGSAAMAWIYFIIVLVFIGIISFIINKIVYYEVE